MVRRIGLLVVFILGLAPAAASVADPETIAPYTVSDRGNAGTAPVAGEAVYRALHGRAGIERIVSDLLAHVQTDPRISDIFKAMPAKLIASASMDKRTAVLSGRIAAPC